jgi:hypothetical protein
MHSSTHQQNQSLQSIKSINVSQRKSIQSMGSSKDGGDLLDSRVNPCAKNESKTTIKRIASKSIQSMGSSKDGWEDGQSLDFLDARVKDIFIL